MVRPGLKRTILAVGGAIVAAVYPERACDDEGRRVFEEEAREGNAGILRWIALLTVPINALSVALFIHLPEGDPARTAWLFLLTCFNAVLSAAAVLTAIVAWSRRPAALWRVLGDIGGVLWLFGAAARSANSQ